MRLRLALLALPLAALCCRADPPPSPDCPPCPSPAPCPSAAPSATAAVDAGPPAPAPDDNPWCSPGDANYGAWTATREEVVAAARKLKAACAPPDWFMQAAGDCMQRLGRSSVRVLAGVMDGERATQMACDMSVTSAEWNGRRWIAIRSDIRDGHAFYAYADAFEMKPTGPVQVTNQCQGSPTAATGPYGRRLEPAGWEKLPKDLRERLCAF